LSFSFFHDLCYLTHFFDDANFFVSQAVELVDKLVDLFVRRVDLALRPIYDYSAIGQLLKQRLTSWGLTVPSVSPRTTPLKQKNLKMKV
jgi:hypothetical protein